MSVQVENHNAFPMASNNQANTSNTTLSENELSHTSSSEATTDAETDAYNYDTVFPSLPMATGPVNMLSGTAWQTATESRLSIRKRHTTQVFHVPVEERRYKDMANSFGNETNKKCEEIANRLGVKVEMCCSKDQSLHIVISGLEDKVVEAKRSIVNELQTERDTKIRVPKEQHKFLVGKNGSVLKELQEKSCTKIQVPKSDSTSDLISITGPKDGIELAIHEIQLLVDEQSKSALERLDIPKLYHPWLRGFNNETVNEIAARTGAKINIPPVNVERNEVVVSGEREKVELACAELRRIHDDKAKLKMTKIALQITKSQHKLIIGKNGSNVQEIFKEHDVYVQIPKSDTQSETIYLYGEESKVGPALTQVCAKANSVVTVSIDVPSWLHRHMIGEKGANISKITADYPNTHVKFEPDNKIVLDGPPDEVEKCKERLENITAGLKQIMVCEEVTCEPKLYAQLIMNSNANNNTNNANINKKNDAIARINKEHGVIIRPSQASGVTNVMRIEGAPESVQRAKEDFVEMLKRMENERSKDIIIESRYHSTLIGRNGKNLNEIRAKFNDIQISIPREEEKSDVVTIRGDKLEVEKCFKYLQQLCKEMQENGYQEELHIFKEFHRILVGKQGAFIRRIRDETKTRIDVPAADNEDANAAITITGKRENVLKARKLLEDKIKELVNIKEDTVDIPHQFHTALIGKGGAIIRQIRSECGDIIITFPTAESSDTILLKGPPDDIKKAKQELLKLAEHQSDLSYSEEVHAKAEFHRYLVGPKGANVNALRDKHNVRILFPATTNSSSASASKSPSNENSKQPASTPGKSYSSFHKKKRIPNDKNIGSRKSSFFSQALLFQIEHIF